ncbi:MAG: hypothetical protein ACREN5_12995 [Gemmatimonadales bacterium]
MDSLDWSDQHDELFSTFGQLMFEMQGLERSLAIELGMVYGPGPATITREQVRSLVESYFTKTLGTLKNLISGVAEFPDTLKARLNEAVTIRNFIAHHYFWGSSPKSVMLP